MSRRRKTSTQPAILQPTAAILRDAAGFGFQLRVNNGGQHWQVLAANRIAADYWPSTGRLNVRGEDPDGFIISDNALVMHRVRDCYVAPEPQAPVETAAAVKARDREFVDDLIVALCHGDDGWRRDADEIIKRANAIALAREAFHRNPG